MDKNKRDVSEALNLFDRLSPEGQKKVLTFLRLLRTGDAEKIRLFCEQEGLDPNKDYEKPA